jgi:hypothetical protein
MLFDVSVLLDCGEGRHVESGVEWTQSFMFLIPFEREQPISQICIIVGSHGKRVRRTALCLRS